MTDEPKVTSLSESQILEKAVEKAVKNGWSLDALKKDAALFGGSSIIFSHDFAKAFWGDGDYVGDLASLGARPSYIYHLQQMVIREEPLKYLEKFLDD